MAFVIEEIPDSATLFRRIHEAHLVGGRVSSAAYNDSRLSVNWENYSDVQKAVGAKTAAVTALVAGVCRSIGQTVEHTPVEATPEIESNQAHAEICGHKTKPIKQRLRDLAVEVWRRPLAA